MSKLSNCYLRMFSYNYFMKKIFICAIFIVILISGCIFRNEDQSNNENELAEDLIERNSDIDIEISQEGESGVAWPKGISSDIPEFKYGKLEISFDGSNTLDTGTLIQIINVEEDAFEKYAKDLRNKGWEVEDNVLTEYGIEGVRLEATKNDYTIYLDKDPMGENTAFLTIEKIGQEAPVE